MVLQFSLTISPLTLVNFDDRTSLQDVQAFMKTLARDMVTLGMGYPFSV